MKLSLFNMASFVCVCVVCVHSSGHIWGVGGEVSGAHFNGWLRNTCIFELKFLINNNCINANTF
jgi:hypothetical protein